MRNNSVRFFSIFFAAVIFYSVTPSCSKNSSQTRRTTNNVTVIDNIKYGSNTDWQGNTENMLMDIYLPPGASDAQKLPLIVYVHGGGFVDGDKSDKRTLMIDFANSGFVSVSINYRLGWTQGTNCNGDTTEAKEAIY